MFYPGNKGIPSSAESWEFAGDSLHKCCCKSCSRDGLVRTATAAGGSERVPSIVGRLVSGWDAAPDAPVSRGEGSHPRGRESPRRARPPGLPPLRGRRGCRRLHAQLPDRPQVLLPVGRVGLHAGAPWPGHFLLDKPFFSRTACDLLRSCKDGAQTSHVSLPRFGSPDVTVLCHQARLSKPRRQPRRLLPSVLRAVFNFFGFCVTDLFPPPIPPQAATLHVIVVFSVPWSRSPLLFQGDGFEGLPGPFPAETGRLRRSPWR